MKTYVLCTTLENDTTEIFESLKDKIDMSSAVIHIVKIVEIQTPSSFSFSSYYPSESECAAIEASSIHVMRNLANSLKVPDENVVLKCFFETNRNEKIYSYLKEVKADLVITATRSKHGIEGFFSSSFTDYLCKFSPCDVLVMRPLIK